MVGNNDRYKRQDPKFDRRRGGRNKPCPTCGGIGTHLKTCRFYKPKGK